MSATSTGLLTTSELYAAKRALVYVVNATSEQRVQYVAQINALEEQWAAWLAVEYANGLPAETLTDIFKDAWGVAGVYGYDAVETEYREIAGIAGMIHALRNSRRS